MRKEQERLCKTPTDWWKYRDGKLHELDADYKNVQIKGALNGMSQDKAKKMLTEFANKQYLQA